MGKAADLWDSMSAEWKRRGYDPGDRGNTADLAWDVYYGQKDLSEAINEGIKRGFRDPSTIPGYGEVEMPRFEMPNYKNMQVPFISNKELSKMYVPLRNAMLAVLKTGQYPGVGNLNTGYDDAIRNRLNERKSGDADQLAEQLNKQGISGSGAMSSWDQFRETYATQQNELESELKEKNLNRAIQQTGMAQSGLQNLIGLGNTSLLSQGMTAAQSNFNAALQKAMAEVEGDIRSDLLRQQFINQKDLAEESKGDWTDSLGDIAKFGLTAAMMATGGGAGTAGAAGLNLLPFAEPIFREGTPLAAGTPSVYNGRIPAPILLNSAVPNNSNLLSRIFGR